MKYSSIARRVLKEEVEMDFAEDKVNFTLDGVNKSLPRGEFIQALQVVDRKEREKTKRDLAKAEYQEEKRLNSMWNELVSHFDDTTWEEAADMLAESLLVKLMIDKELNSYVKDLELLETPENKEQIDIAFNKFLKEEYDGSDAVRPLDPEALTKFKDIIYKQHAKESRKSIVKSMVKIELGNKETLHFLNCIKKVIPLFKK